MKKASGRAPHVCHVTKPDVSVYEVHRSLELGNVFQPVVAVQRLCMMGCLELHVKWWFRILVGIQSQW